MSAVLQQVSINSEAQGTKDPCSPVQCKCQGEGFSCSACDAPYSTPYTACSLGNLPNCGILQFVHC